MFLFCDLYAQQKEKAQNIIGGPQILVVRVKLIGLSQFQGQTVLHAHQKRGLANVGPEHY